MPSRSDMPEEGGAGGGDDLVSPAIVCGLTIRILLEADHRPLYKEYTSTCASVLGASEKAALWGGERAEAADMLSLDKK